MANSQLRSFPYALILIVALFMTIMASVVAVAYIRPSGRMGLDMDQLHLKRVAAVIED